MIPVKPVIVEILVAHIANGWFVNFPLMLSKSLFRRESLTLSADVARFPVFHANSPYRSVVVNVIVTVVVTIAIRRRFHIALEGRMKLVAMIFHHLFVDGQEFAIGTFKLESDVILVLILRTKFGGGGEVGGGDDHYFRGLSGRRSMMLFHDFIGGGYNCGRGRN